MSHRGLNNQYHSESSDSDSDSISNITTILNNIVLQPTSNLNIVNMPEVPVLKQEYLSMIPEFHGETELLPRFIQICQKLVTKFYNANNADDFQNEYLMSSILAKIKGEAAINISSCVIGKWADLQTALLNAYADKRDVYTLNIELTNLKQGSESAFDFYNRIQHILNLAISYLTTHSTAAEALVLNEYSRNLALRVLLLGLRDPIGSLMRVKNPANLNAALGMLTNDFQIGAYQEKQSKFKYPQKLSPLNKQGFQNKQANPLQLTNFAHNSQFVPQQSNYYRNVAQHSNGTQQSNRNSNVFRPNQFKNFPKPTPMSVSTRNTGAPQNYSHNYRPNQFANNKPNYIVEELFNIEDEGDPPSVEYPINDDISDGDQFFRETASEEQESQNSN